MVILVLCSVIFCCLSLDNILYNNLYPVSVCPRTILLVRQPRGSEWVNKSTSTYRCTSMYVCTCTPIVYTYSNVTGTHAGLLDRLCHPSVCQCVRGVTDSAGRVSRSGHPSVLGSFFIHYTPGALLAALHGFYTEHNVFYKRLYSYRFSISPIDN